MTNERSIKRLPETNNLAIIIERNSSNAPTRDNLNVDGKCEESEYFINPVESSGSNGHEPLLKSSRIYGLHRTQGFGDEFNSHLMN